jgi:hypothetical protein
VRIERSAFPESSSAHGLLEIEKVFSLHLGIRSAALWFAVVLIGLIERYFLLPFDLAAFVDAIFLPRSCFGCCAEVVTIIDRADYRLRTTRRVIPLPLRSFSPPRRAGPGSHSEASREHDGEL